MSESKPMVTWTCERCKRTETMVMSDQPTGWCRITIVTPPRRDPNDRSVVWDICNPCETSLVREWKQRPPA